MTAAVAHERPPRPAAPREEGAALRTVLVVDDNPADRALYRHLLAEDPHHDYRMEAAATGAQAIERFCAAVDDPVPFDAILLDYRLPDMEGTEVLDELRRLRPCELLPVIMLTGEGSESIAVEAMKRGAVDYIAKRDLTIDTLRRAVDHAVDNMRLRRLLRRRQRELGEARRREGRLRDDFLGQVSHELRTPLSVVYRFVDMLLDGVAGEPNEEQREFLEIALRNCEHLRRMIDDLLESARVREGQLELARSILDLRHLADEIVQERRVDAEAAELSLVVAGEGTLPAAWADEARVRQVLGNLLDNAFKFTPAGGRVTVTVELDPGHPGYLQLRVADTGRGIPQQDLGRVFERLHQVRGDDERHGGLGFGLYIARRIVELHGGRITAESAPGAGATLRVTLPVFAPHRVLRPLVSAEGRVPGVVDLVRVEVQPADGAPARDANATEHRHGELRDWARDGIARLLAGHRATLLPMDGRDVFWIAVSEGEGDGSHRLVAELRAWLAAPGPPPRRTSIEEVSLPTRAGGEEPVNAQLDRLGERIAELIAYRERKAEPPWNLKAS